jgi:LPXTG-motif cell wall-anchored protein
VSTTRRTLLGLGTTLVGITVLSATMAAQQSTTERTKGTATVTTEKMSGEVVAVGGNSLIVKMSNGQLRTFSNVPESRRAVIDGKEVGVRDLQPGTKLQATVTKTTTPVTVRTTTVGTGRVVFLAGTSVVLALPNGENKQYTVKPDYKFTVNGKPASVYDLRPGMTVSAEKIVEEPTVEIATNTQVVGQAPAPKAAAAAPASTQAAAPAPAPATTAPAPAAAPAARLPKTGSPVPLGGLMGLLLIGGSLAIRRYRRS